MCILMKKDHIRMAIAWCMLESGGLWKQQSKPACAKSVKTLQNAEVGHYMEEGGSI